MKVLVLFYTTYGHNYEMAKAVAEGVKQAGVEVEIKRVPEILPDEIISRMGALEARKAFEHIPIAEPTELGDYDGIIFGTPTRYGMMAAQMKAFLDATGSLWAKGALIGKVGAVFSSTGTQHGGQEAAILSFHTILLHHGMLISGLPYSFTGQTTMDMIAGGSPYGASQIVGGDGSKPANQIELDGGRFLGEHVANIVKKLAK